MRAVNDLGSRRVFFLSYCVIVSYQTLTTTTTKKEPKYIFKSVAAHRRDIAAAEGQKPAEFHLLIVYPVKLFG